MFSRLLPDDTPSTWRLAAMQAFTIAASIGLCLYFTGVAMKRDLQVVARQVLQDDLGEYSVVYNRYGIEGLEQMFKTGRHDRHEAMRVTNNGQVLEQVHRALQGGEFPWPEESAMKVLTGPPGSKSFGYPQGNESIFIGRVLLNDGAILWHGRTNDADLAAIQNINRQLGFAGVAASLIAFIPVFWYAGRVMKPVRHMIASAQSLAQGRGQSRLIVAGAVPELREFADAFNTVLDRNEALAAELQAANDHLAHELRTPIARIRGNLEHLHDSITDAGIQETAARGMDEIDRASSLVQSILTVRAGEHNALKLHVEPLSLSGLIEDIVELYSVSAEDKNLRLRIDAVEDVTLTVDQQRLTQALANLLDNAMAYTPSGGDILVQLIVVPDSCTIQVIDSGPGVRPDEMDRIWMRFMRGAAANARTPGMGLGLSLVQAVAHAHGGSVGCSNNLPGSGATFWIKLPRS